jgi:hypothetical protein
MKITKMLSVLLTTTVLCGAVLFLGHDNAVNAQARISLSDLLARIEALEAAQSAPPTVKFLNISAFGFVPATTNFSLANAWTVNFSGDGFFPTGTASLQNVIVATSLQLPQDSTITSAECFYTYPDAGNVFSIQSFLTRRRIDEAIATVVGTESAATPVAMPGLQTLGPFATSEIVDNESFQYSLQVVFRETRTKLPVPRFWGCRVTYE